MIAPNDSEEAFDRDLEESFERYLRLRHKAAKFLDAKAQAEIDTWLAVEEPRFKFRAAQLGISYKDEVLRITSMFRVR